MSINFSINEDDVLVSYEDIPYGIVRNGRVDTISISEPDFRELSSQLPIIVYRNKYFPFLYLQITERCNMKCKHCFAYSENVAGVKEWSYDELIDLLDQAKACGIKGITLTGGEPTVHSRFLDIFDAIYERGMQVIDLNTNGILLSDEMLQHIKDMGADPNMKISFDGIGVHDFMRGVPGCEPKVLEAMRRCIQYGFRTYSQTQINRRTMDVIPQTLELLDDMGCRATRLIRTSDAPRWVENCKGDTLGFDEYFDFCFELTEKYLAKKHNMILDIWQFDYINPKDRIPYSIPTDYVREPSEDNRPICDAFSNQIAIAGDGEVYPCLEMQGYCDKFGIRFGNVKELGLQKILSSGKMLDYIKTPICQRAEHNPECHDCKYRSVCTGGCPAMGILFSGGDFLGVDKSKCMFFHSGAYEKMMKLAGAEDKIIR